jgi:hypothetical protein
MKSAVIELLEISLRYVDGRFTRIEAMQSFHSQGNESSPSSTAATEVKTARVSRQRFPREY